MSVKYYRLKKGYTQKEIASKLGIKQHSYSQKENENRGFTIEELLALEILLGASIGEMFKETKDKINDNLKN